MQNRMVAEDVAGNIFGGKTGLNTAIARHQRLWRWLATRCATRCYSGSPGSRRRHRAYWLCVSGGAPFRHRQFAQQSSWRTALAIVRGVVVTAGRGRLLARMLRVCWPLRTRWWPRVPSALPAAGSESNRQLVQDWADRWRLRGDRATVKYRLSRSRRRPRILLPRSSWLRFRVGPLHIVQQGLADRCPELSWFRRARRGHRRAIPPLSRRGLETSAEPLFRSAPVPKYCPTTHSHWCPKGRADLGPPYR